MPRNSFRLFLAALVFSPLAFGSVEQWSLALMMLLCFVGMLVYMHENRLSLPFYKAPGALPLFCLLGFFLLQLIPLPAEAVRLVSPHTYKVYAETVGIVEPRSWMPLSLNPRATLLELLRLAAYAAFYILTVQLLTRKELLKKTLTVVVFFASAVALLALVQYLFQTKKIFWFRDISQPHVVPFGPYVNRNHYAGFMEMIFPLALSVFLTYKPQFSYASLRDRAAALLSRRETDRYLLTGLFAVLIAASIFLSLSRSGIVSLCFSMILFGVLFLKRRRNRRRGAVIIAVFAAIVLLVGWFGWEPILDRFERVTGREGNISDLRPIMWGDTVEIIKDFPAAGTGLGSFVSVYPKFKSVYEERIVDHAHNDYLEFLAEGGGIGLALMAWFMAAVFIKTFRAYRRRKDSYAINLWIGSVAGMVALLLHSLTDFNLRIGANGLYFFFLAGLAVSASHTRLREGLGATLLQPVDSRRSPAALKLSLYAIAAISLLVNAGALAAEFSHSLFKNERFDITTPRNELAAVRELAGTASLFDPLNADYHSLHARFSSLLLDHETALVSYKRALALEPTASEHLQRLGLAYTLKEQPGTAERLFLRAIAYDRMNPQRYKAYASWLLSQGKREESLRNLATAHSIAPRKTKDIITFMVLSGFTDSEIHATLPARAEAHLAYAGYLAGIDNDEGADESYRKALQLLTGEREVKQAFFLEPFRYYMKKERHQDALAVMRQAASYFPGDAAVRYAAGAAYEKLGMYNSAVDAYKKALLLNPAHQEARQRLEFLSLKRGGG